VTAPGTTPKMDLYQRFTDLLGTHDIHPEDREKLQDAFEAADGWDDLPGDIQAMVVDLEKLPVQRWDDPADVPDEIMQTGEQPTTLTATF